jgi:transposase
MKNIAKQVVGIDVAQKELVVCLGRMHDDWTPELYSHGTFANSKKGFDMMVKWVKKLTIEATAVRYVMEATGVYHESLAYYLEGSGYEVSVVLPNKISNYIRTLEVKTITDKTASEAIARFGLERKLDMWKRPKQIFKNLKQLTRERDQIVETRTLAKNQLHAETAEAYPNPSSLHRIKALIKFLDKQVAEILKEITELVKQDDQVNESIDLICSIPGVGRLTAATVLAETNGFELIRNKRQLTSYAGLDVKEKQSGTSIKGKPRISKKGNRHLRKAMHLPALTAIRHEKKFKAIFVRLVSKHGIKMKAAVAVQRKLLEMIYTIYSKNTAYDKNYLNHNEAELTELDKHYQFGVKQKSDHLT